MEVKAEVNAKKATYQKDQARELLSGATDLYAAKGKNVVHVNLKKTELTTDELLRLIMGPTGNLRAPTLRLGKTLIVGFHQETYEQLLDGPGSRG